MTKGAEPQRRIGRSLAAAFAGAALAAAWSSSASAAVYILDFGLDCCRVGAATVDQSYGDAQGVNVSYRSLVAANGTTYANQLHRWENGYGDLKGVIYGGANSTSHQAEITFNAAPGYEVRLISFDVGTYQGLSATTPISITSLAGVSILSGTYGTNPGSHNHLDVNSGFFTDGIRLVWGPDAYNVGLDNIAFEVRALPVSGVPEPSTWAMMILGFGGAGAMMRRRRTSERLLLQAG